ncbi:hypothetical protein GCM10010451_23380 [Streptomyces virens]|uniref:Uncharacterized protein n=1 Tax=Streptomyces virens TaxID=285572 RepID=A0ABP6PE56_9ACTN
MAVRWGWEPREPVGKTVWAEVPCRAGCGNAETDPLPAYNH